MFKMSDQNYLLTAQYHDASNLNARAQLHRDFSTNKYGWCLWVFDQFDLPSQSRILELGCGPGGLWLENIHRIPDGWEIVLSDLSWGMLQHAQRDLGTNQGRFHFLTVDAQSVPFEAESFDAVIANHMLYHVPDRAAAFSDIRRVLSPGGRLYAATNGRAHLQELRELVERFDPSIALGTRDYSFSLENGSAQLSKWFHKVTLRRYEDSLAVTEADPLVAYILSSIGNARSVLVGDKREELVTFIERELTSDGVIHITKDVGIFEACRRDDA
jgi:ubiquinone/menaquinone biosynthesis C-methylase UbiE